MPSIKPFNAIIYNRKRIKDISKVLAPPYDIIPPAMQESLYKIHDNNVVRLILNKIMKSDTENDNRYTRSGAFFRSWLNENILIEDTTPAIYIYSQSYKYAGKTIERIGFISLMGLDLEDKKVLPHEKTLKAPKEDRLRLMRATEANLSPIFMLYEDRKHAVNKILKSFSKKTKPFISVTADGARHKVWKLSDKKAIDAVERAMNGKDIFIADGHHRYETSKNFVRELIDKGADKERRENAKLFMAYFVELEEKSLTILPTHRLIKDANGLSEEDVIKKLDKYFVIEKLSSEKKLLARLCALRAHHAFGMCLGKGSFFCLKLKDFKLASSFMGSGSADWKSLDVSILHLFILQYILRISDADDNIEFVKDPADAFNAMDKGDFNMAFFLNPTKVTQVKRVAERGEKMPRKATYFYPKPLSGLVIRKI